MRAVYQLSKEFIRAHPADAAPILERLAPQEVSELLEDLPPSTAARAVESLVSTLAAECLSGLPRQRAGAILAELPPDVAAVILVRLDPADRPRLLAELPPKPAAELSRRLRYREGSAGAIVDARVLAFPDQISAAEALSRLRRASHRAHYYVYVVDREEKLQGVMTLRELLLAPPKQPLAAVMKQPVSRLMATADRTSIAANPSWKELHALPVVDESGRFMGIVGHETVKRLEAESQQRGAPGHTVSLGMEFADLCWVGMTGLLSGLAAAILGPYGDPLHQEERPS